MVYSSRLLVKRRGSDMKYCLRNTFWVLLVSYVLIVMFERSPHDSQIYENFGSIDCKLIRYKSIYNGDNTLTFTFHNEETFEYPFSHLVNSLTIEIFGDKYFSRYTRNDFTNLSRDGDVFNITVPYSASGVANISFKCMNGKFDSVTQEINDSKLVPSYSSSIYSEHDLLNLRNVCFNKSSFEYFSNYSIYHNDINYFNTTYPMHTRIFDYKIKLETENVTQTDDYTVIIPNFDMFHWKQILFSINPLLLSLRTLGNSSKRIHLKTVNSTQRGVFDIIKKFAPNIQLTYSSLSDGCFSQVIFPRMNHSIDISHDIAIRRYIEQNFSVIQMMFGHPDVSDKSIALPYSLSFLNSTIKEMCNECSVEVIPRKDLVYISDLVSGSTYLVGNHISNIVYSVFLANGKGSLINVSPKEDRCIDWETNFTNRLNISHIAMYNNKECTCKSFKCYSKSPINEVNIDDFKILLSRVFVN